MRVWIVGLALVGCGGSPAVTFEDTAVRFDPRDTLDTDGLTEAVIHRPGPGWEPVPMTVLFAGWTAGDERPPDDRSWDCEAPVHVLADRPEDLTGLAAQALDFVPNLRGFDGAFQDAFVGWSWYCERRPRTTRVLGAWQNGGVLRVAWYAPEGGDDHPGRPWLVALIPQQPWAAVVPDFFLVSRDELPDDG